MSFSITVRRLAAAVPILLGAAAIAASPVQAQQPPGVVPFIVGGGNATESYPFIGSVQVNGGHFCGSSLISSQWLVTAGHCTFGQSGPLQASQVRVRLGSADQSTGGTLAQVAQIVRHPSYNNNDINGGFDIALLRLSQPATQTPITIASSSPAANSSTRLLGWGQTCPQQGCGQAPRMLKQLDTRVLSDQNCQNIAQSSSELCISGTSTATACYGDSGGPSVTQVNGTWQLNGATSRSGGSSTSCGAPGNNVVYTDVVAFRQWIQSAQSGGGGGDPGPGPQCPQAWAPGQNYPPGTTVSSQGLVWQALSWSFGLPPGQSRVWRAVARC